MSAIPASSVKCSTLVDGTLRIVVEVEPNHALDAFTLFRSPGTPMALAALKVVSDNEQPEPPPAQKPLKEGPRRKVGPICEWLVMRCREPEFQQWIRGPYDKAMGGNGNGWGDISPEDVGGLERYARHACLVLCGGIESRKDIDGDAAAEALFRRRIQRPWADHQAKQGATA